MDLFIIFVFTPIALIVGIGAMALAEHILKMKPGKEDPVKSTVFIAVGLAAVLFMFWVAAQLGW